MSEHDDSVSLHHMLDHAREAVQFADSRKRSDLDSDRLLELALTRLIEVIGEAAGRVSPATRMKYQTIPWPQIVGMRNRLIHGYDSIDRQLLWDTIQQDLPPLIATLESILGPNETESN